MVFFQNIKPTCFFNCYIPVHIPRFDLSTKKAIDPVNMADPPGPYQGSTQRMVSVARPKWFRLTAMIMAFEPSSPTWRRNSWSTSSWKWLVLGELLQEKLRIQAQWDLGKDESFIWLSLDDECWFRGKLGGKDGFSSKYRFIQYRFVCRVPWEPQKIDGKSHHDFPDKKCHSYPPFFRQKPYLWWVVPYNFHVTSVGMGEESPGHGGISLHVFWMKECPLPIRVHVCVYKVIYIYIYT